MSNDENLKIRYKKLAEVKEFIERNVDEILFVAGGIQNDDIKQMENDLGVVFPVDYKIFLKEYGGCSVLGVTIFGVTAMPYPSIVDITKEYRQYGLPNRYIVYENCDEYVNCIDADSSSEKFGETISWSYVDKKVHYYGRKIFESFILELSDAEENL